MNTDQFLIVYKSPILFSILDEIKNNLNFNIKHYKNEQFREEFSKKNMVVITELKKIKFENQIKVEEFPINIQKLIEIINIQFLKNKFNQQNNLKVGEYFLNLNSRTISHLNKTLSLTEKEIKIITFLKNFKKPVSVEKLQSEVWGYRSKLETHTVETHVYRLRKKIEKNFDDKSFIMSLKNGYKI
ncbi:hypothetical protein AKH21_03130 [Pelagibacteraceae bacterium GOM-A5]|nr:hypothetical protein AKH21_03130 [Pelagibacteraceae bacterium GOM-A5]